jgi:hypothetical protein
MDLLTQETIMNYCAMDGCSYFCSHKREHNHIKRLKCYFYVVYILLYLYDFVSKIVFKKNSNS